MPRLIEIDYSIKYNYIAFFYCDTINIFNN